MMSIHHTRLRTKHHWHRNTGISTQALKIKARNFRQYRIFFATEHAVIESFQNVIFETKIRQQPRARLAPCAMQLKDMGP